jgi:hypothetical protein
MASLLDTGPRFISAFPTLAPTIPSTPLDFGGRLLDNPRNFTTPRPLIGSPIVVGEGPTSTGRRTHCIKVFFHSLVSDKLRSPDRMSTNTHNTPQSTSPGEQMDFDTPPVAVMKTVITQTTASNVRLPQAQISEHHRRRRCHFVPQLNLPHSPHLRCPQGLTHIPARYLSLFRRNSQTSDSWKTFCPRQFLRSNHSRLSQSPSAPKMLCSATSAIHWTKPW